MAQRELGVALQVAAHKAIVLYAEIESRGAGIVDGGHAVFLGQRDHSQNAADAELGFVAKNRLAELTDVGAALAARANSCMVLSGVFLERSSSLMR